MEKNTDGRSRVYLNDSCYNKSGIGRYIGYLIENENLYAGFIGDAYSLEKKVSKKKIINHLNRTFSVIDNFFFYRKKIKKEDVLHCPGWDIPVGYQGRMVVTVHDIIPLRCKAAFDFKFRIGFFIQMFYAVHKAERIITVSNHTKKDIIRKFHISEKKIRVIYNGISEQFRTCEKEEYAYLYSKYQLEGKKVFLCVGNKAPHKNLRRTLEAFSILPDIEQYRLILAGGKISEIDDIRKIVKELHIEKSVIDVKKVTDEELLHLYNLADVFLFFSLYEGFGIPLLEAMVCGTPVICSNTTSIPEVVGNAAIKVNPRNVDEMSTAILRVIKNPKLQKDMIQRGYNRAKQFSWEKCVKEHEECFRDLKEYGK